MSSPISSHVTPVRRAALTALLDEAWGRGGVTSAGKD